MTSMVVNKPELQRVYSVEREALIVSYCKVIDEINIRNTHILGYLIEKMVINQSEKEYISNGETYKARNERLVDTIIKKHRPEAIKTFILALEEDHEWLAKHIREIITTVKRERYTRQRSPAFELALQLGTGVNSEGKLDPKRNTTEQKLAAHLSKDREAVEDGCESFQAVSSVTGLSEFTANSSIDQNYATGINSCTKPISSKKDATTQMSNSLQAKYKDDIRSLEGKCLSAEDQAPWQQGPSDLDLHEDFCLDSERSGRQPFISHPSSFKGGHSSSITLPRTFCSTVPSEEMRSLHRFSNEIGFPSQVSDEEASIKQVVPSIERTPVEVSLSVDTRDLQNEAKLDMSPTSRDQPLSRTEGHMPVGFDEIDSTPEDAISIKQTGALRVRPAFRQSVSAVETRDRPPITPPVHSNSAEGPRLLHQSNEESETCSTCHKPLRRTTSYLDKEQSAKIKHCTCAIKRKDSDQLRQIRGRKINESHEFITCGLQLFNRDQISTVHERPAKSSPLPPSSIDHYALVKQPSRNTHVGVTTRQGELENDKARNDDQSEADRRICDKDGGFAIDVPFDQTFANNQMDSQIQTTVVEPMPSKEGLGRERTCPKGKTSSRKVSDIAGLDMVEANIKKKNSRGAKKCETLQTGAVQAMSTAFSLIGLQGSDESDDITSAQGGNTRIVPAEPAIEEESTKKKNIHEKRALCRTDANIISKSSLESSMEDGCYKVVLQRHADYGYGFKFISGKGERARFPGDEDYYITKIIPGSPAEMEPQMRTHDTIISINGVTIRHKEHEEVWQLFRQAGEIHMLLRINQESELI